MIFIGFHWSVWFGKHRQTFSTKWVVDSANLFYKMGPTISLQNGLSIQQTFSTKWVGVFCLIIEMAKMPSLQNGLQAHSKSTFNINTSDGVRSHFVETNRWGVRAHFVVGSHFILQNGVHNPTRSIGRGMYFLLEEVNVHCHVCVLEGRLTYPHRIYEWYIYLRLAWGFMVNLGINIWIVWSILDG